MRGRKAVELTQGELLEQLAALEHEQWVHWTTYMLSRLGYHPSTSNPIVKRWYRQIIIPYSELSEREKKSDREWARKVLEIVNGGGKYD